MALLAAWACTPTRCTAANSANKLHDVISNLRIDIAFSWCCGKSSAGWIPNSTVRGIRELFRNPDPEIPTTVQHVHDVQHAVEIPLLPIRNRRPPQLRHESLFVRSRRRCQPACGGRGQHPSRLPRGERLATQHAALAQRADALADKELLDAIAQHPLLRRLMPPVVIHR